MGFATAAPRDKSQTGALHFASPSRAVNKRFRYQITRNRRISIRRQIVAEKILRRNQDRGKAGDTGLSVDKVVQFLLYGYHTSRPMSDTLECAPVVISFIFRPNRPGQFGLKMADI